MIFDRKTAYDRMIALEKDIADAFNAAKIRAPVHLSGGNEEQLLGIFERIEPDDWVLSTWRSHYHCLLKGVPSSIILEDVLAGRSITLCYPEQRVLTSAIVAGCLPIGIGIASAIKRASGMETVWCFVGDMAARTGTFDECARYAAGHDLPIEFVVEGNGLSVSTPTQAVWNDDGAASPYDRVTSYDYKLGWPHAGAGKRINF